MSTYHAAGPARQALPDWSPRWWLLYAIVPLFLLAAVMTAHLAGGAIRYWMLESRVGILESATGAMALAAGVVALIDFFPPAIRHDCTVSSRLLCFFVVMH